MATLRSALAQLKPDIDSVLNAQIADVIGNKSDSINGTSLVAIQKQVKTQTDNIDEHAVLGLAGTVDSLAYKVHEIEKHFHNSAQWYGKDSVDDLLNRDSVTPFVLTAGDDQDYGTEVQLSDGTEIEGGSATKKFDFHKILITDNNAGNTSTTFKFELWYGTGIFAAATLLTECVANFYSISDNHGVMEFPCPRIACNNKLWARVKCNVNGKSCSILVGVHVYEA